MPLLDFIGLYKPELNAFFANTVAATQARSTATRVHYLRTTNPFNPENLAVYPRRLGTNRPNAYTKPGMFNKLRGGLEVYEDRHCGRAIPGVGNDAGVLPQVVPDAARCPSLPVPSRRRADAAPDHRAAAGARPERAAGPDQQVRLLQRPPGLRAGAALQEAGARTPTAARRRSTRT